MSKAASELSRRSLLKGALVLGFALPVATKLKAANLAPGAAPLSPTGEVMMPNGFIRIDAQDISFIIPNVEMGQGIYTAEAMLIAEELEVRLDQIKVVPAPPNPDLYMTPLLHFQGTGGSTSIRSWWEPLRKAGATTRSMLLMAAANRWSVEPAGCVAADGRIVHGETGRSLAYTEIAAEAAALPPPADVILKDPATFKLVGKSAKRVDMPGKVDGSAIFGLDVRVPGMKVASVIASPVFGGTLRSVDDSEAMKIPGYLRTISIPNAVAAVADNTWAANRAAAALRILWDDGHNINVSTASIRAELATASKDGTPIVALNQDGAVEGLSKGTKRVDATYELPFLAHATMEPINTIVHVQPDACDIWCGTQVPATAVMLAAQITGLPQEKVRMHNQLIGGGFGRRLEADSIAQATAFAKQVDYPLQVVWTREEDIRQDYFRPAYHDHVSAALGAGDLPVAMWHRTTGGSVLARFAPAAMGPDGLDSDVVEGSVEIPYDIPKRRVDWVRHDPPKGLPFSWWRGVGPAHNVFVIETFIDELAHKAGQDPIEYRAKMLAHNPRALAVLRLAEKESQWGTPLPARHGRGVSLHQAFGSFCALVVEVAVWPEGTIKLVKATAAIDCGFTVNPDTMVAQIEGGTLFGLSAALFSGIEFEGGKTVQSNFHDYRILRIDEAPRMTVHHIQNAENPGGIGEVGTASAFPALGNALFAATGVRLRATPFDHRQLVSQSSDKPVLGSLAPTAGVSLALAALGKVTGQTNSGDNE
ncbi:molybdopterin cofactor-binding domain-containing protein [Rhizobium sp. Rhizsp42]|uniref:xanthine dehydrogenase family protein molybdopterin-binding subunit n=1 Tax=Rhizobium sp. Rhizsp42 TaxID=3243034 RepID=UPI0039B0049C